MMKRGNLQLSTVSGMTDRAERGSITSFVGTAFVHGIRCAVFVVCASDGVPTSVVQFVHSGETGPGTAGGLDRKTTGKV